jgi:hypothetical protein
MRYPILFLKQVGIRRLSEEAKFFISMSSRLGESIYPSFQAGDCFIIVSSL